MPVVGHSDGLVPEPRQDLYPELQLLDVGVEGSHSAVVHRLRKGVPASMRQLCDRLCRIVSLDGLSYPDVSEHERVFVRAHRDNVPESPQYEFLSAGAAVGPNQSEAGFRFLS